MIEKHSLTLREIWPHICDRIGSLKNRPTPNDGESRRYAIRAIFSALNDGTDIIPYNVMALALTDETFIQGLNNYLPRLGPLGASADKQNYHITDFTLRRS